MGLKSKSLDTVRADVPVADVLKSEMVRVNLNVPKHIRDSWKILAVQRDTDVTAMILEAMNIHTNVHKVK